MKSRLITLIIMAALCLNANAQRGVSEIQSPVEIVKRIGDRLIKDTPFKYKLSVFKNNPTFNGLQFVDFGRTFSLGAAAVAYAYTNIHAGTDTEMNLQLEHNDGCKIWLNGTLVYEKKGDKKTNLIYDERSIEMPEKCSLKLRKGNNELLIKSETRGSEWVVYLQPPGTKGSVMSKISYPEIGLTGNSNVAGNIAGITNWLIIGPFPNPVKGNYRTGIDAVYPPENELEFGKMYAGLHGNITWTIPKVEILGNMIDPLPWGTNYNWNYHNGGVAWAMQQLAELTGEKKYDDYASKFGDFHLNGIPFVEYQVRTLHADSSANNQIINVNLLDFTLAPSLPLIYRLRKGGNFPDREKYEAFVDKMMYYARYRQLRYPGLNMFTRTSPQKYTTWVDDMFMGIPFLIQASQYVKDTVARNVFMQDAAKQVLAFKTQVWDADAKLYMHAKYSEHKTKLPHWSRANGWAIWAMSDVLMYLSKSDPLYKPILSQYRTLSASLIKYQKQSGLWPNVLDRPDSKEEVSGSAIFTMAFARGLSNGWLDAKTYKPVVLKGWDGLKTQIEPDGTVHNICMGTMCSEDVNYYMNRPFFDNDTHGLFAVLFAGIEMEKLLNKQNRLVTKQ